MKLAFVLYRYFPHGGLQRDFLRIAEACAARGHEVRAFVREWEGAEPEWLRVRRLPVRAWTNHGRNRDFARALPTALADWKPDGVIGFNKVPGLDVYYAADPCFLARARQGGRGGWYRLSPRYRAFAAAERRLFEEGDALILALTRRQIDDFRHYYRAKKDRFVLLPPGITRDRAWSPQSDGRRRQWRAELGAGDNDLLLLLLGSGFRTKGLDRAIRAVDHLPQALRERTRLLVVGADNPAPFQALAKELDVTEHVHFLGGRDDVPQILCAADVLLHPAYSEAAGMVLVEALAAGLPVIVTSVCGYAHHVRDSGGGIVLPAPFDQGTFDTALQELLADPSTRHRYHEAGVRFGETADIYDMPARAAALIEGCVAHKIEVARAAQPVGARP